METQQATSPRTETAGFVCAQREVARGTTLGHIFQSRPHLKNQIAHNFVCGFDLRLWLCEIIQHFTSSFSRHNVHTARLARCFWKGNGAVTLMKPFFDGIRLVGQRNKLRHFKKVRAFFLPLAVHQNALHPVESLLASFPTR